MVEIQILKHDFFFIIIKHTFLIIIMHYRFGNAFITVFYVILSLQRFRYKMFYITFDDKKKNAYNNQPLLKINYKIVLLKGKGNK